jgi:hypothetical protein
MTIDPHMHRKNQWVLGRNRREVDARFQFGNSGARRFDFDGYWSGSKWVRGTRNAVEFDSERTANEYIERNLSRMENAETDKARV